MTEIVRTRKCMLKGDARDLCRIQTARYCRPMFSLSLGLIFILSLIFFMLSAKTTYIRVVL